MVATSDAAGSINGETIYTCPMSPQIRQEHRAGQLSDLCDEVGAGYCLAKTPSAGKRQRRGRTLYLPDDVYATIGANQGVVRLCDGLGQSDRVVVVAVAMACR